MLIYYHYEILKTYVEIKDFDRILANKTKNYGKKSFVDIAYNASLV